MSLQKQPGYTGKLPFGCLIMEKNRVADRSGGRVCPLAEIFGLFQGELVEVP